MAQPFMIIKRLLAFLVLGMLANVCSFAASGFRSNLLQEMAVVSGIKPQIDKLTDGCYYDVFSYKNRPLTVVVDNDEVVHVGYTIFSPMQREFVGRDIADFIERYWLSTDLPLKRLKTVEQQMREDRVVFSKGSMSVIAKLQGDSTLSVQTLMDFERRYDITWKKGDVTVCALSFPVDNELLSGRSLIENDQRLADDIQRARQIQPSKDITVNGDMLQHSQEHGYYVLPGESYYMDSLTGNRYFHRDKKNRQFHLLNTPEYGFETIANMLTGTDLPQAENYALTLRQQTYNYQQKIVTTSLRQYVSFCLQSGCTPYVGLISETGNIVEVELVMRNVALGYVHVAKLTFDTAQMGEGSGTVSGRLNAYVPTANVKNLFKDLKTK